MMERRELLTCLTGLNTLLYQASTVKESHNTTNTTADILKKVSELSTFSRDGFDTLLSGTGDFAELQTMVRLVNGLYEFSCVPTFKGREDVGYDRIDFTDITSRAERTIPCVAFLIDNTRLAVSGCIIDGAQVCRQPGMLDLLGRGVLLYAEHAVSKPWTSAKTLSSASQLLNVLLLAATCTTPTQLLCNPPPCSVLAKGLVGSLMTELKLKLKKGIWKNSPASVWVFKWILLQVRFPHLTPLLPVVLPPCLLLTDDHEGAHKAAGVTCLHHVTSEVTLEELRSGGRAEVVVAAVLQALYTQEEEVLQAVLLCLPDVLSIINPPPAKTQPPRHESRYDEVLVRLLQYMELEQRLSARRLYARHLPALLNAMGLALCRHLAAIFSVVDSYLQVPDGPREEARLSALAILHATITQSWPRMPRYASAILTTLLRLVHDLSTEGAADLAAPRRRLVAEAVLCGQLLCAVTAGQAEVLLKAVVDDASHFPGGEGSQAREQCVAFVHEVLLDTT